MRKIICDNYREYEILNWYECKPGDTFLEFDSPFFVLNFLHRLGNNPFNMVSIRYAVSRFYGSTNTSAMTDHEVLQKFAEQIIHGHIKLIMKEELTRIGGGSGDSRRTAERGGTSQQAGGAIPSTTPSRRSSETTNHWIEFRFADNETNQSMSGIKLKIKLPNGNIREYTSNASGVICIDNLPAGTIDIEELRGDDVLEVVQFS